MNYPRHQSGAPSSATRVAAETITPEQYAAVALLPDWAVHAVELATSHQLIGTPRRIHVDGADPRRELYCVPSSDRRSEHIVALDIGVTVLHCDCAAAQHGRICGHAGAVLHALHQRYQTQRETGPNEAWQWWLSGGAW